MIRYVVEAGKSGSQLVVHLSEMPGDSVELPEYPGGFEWGYEGGGPHNLAHAILKHFFAQKFHHDFCKEVVAKKSHPDTHQQVAVFTEQEILDFIRRKLSASNEATD